MADSGKSGVVFRIAGAGVSEGVSLSTFLDEVSVPGANGVTLSRAVSGNAIGELHPTLPTVAKSRAITKLEKYLLTVFRQSTALVP